jgi:DNA-binding transcriptional ArsR family regulator
LARASQDIYHLQSSLLKTMASPRRLEIIHVLGAEGPMEVRKLADYFDMPQPAISQHLAALRTAGLVEAVRDGREVRYQLVDPEIVAACGLMRQVLIRRINRLGSAAAAFTEAEAADAPVAAH